MLYLNITIIIIINKIIYYNFLDIWTNLTQLEILDVSHNELTTFSNDDFQFSLPKNLSKLFASENRLRHFSYVMNNFSKESLHYPTTLKTLDLQNNSIESFDFKFLMQIKFGLQLYISGKTNFEIK